MSLLDHIKSAFGFEPEKLFYPGQEITPIHKNGWRDAYKDISASGPKFGEIVKCLKYVYYKDGIWYIQISGYSDNFDEQCFAPVITDDELELMLNDIDELTITRQTWS